MTIENVKKYYGFARKSGVVAIGVDKIMTCRNAYIIMASSDLSQNAKNRLQRRAEKLNSIYQEYEPNEFQQIEPNSSIKAVAIKSKELAAAMQK